MNQTAHFDVFLSHNSRDKALVERLAAKLKRAGLEPWLDKWCLTPGGRWQEELVAGLHSSGACAVFVGRHGLGDWVHEELGVALDRAAKDRSFRLFLVLLPGLPEPFDPTTLPPFLSTRTWVDLRPGIEDSRAFQHLINAIKGVPFGSQLPIEPNDDTCPYRGLQTFDEDHADMFFGRENDIQRLVEKLKGTRFLAVLGPSGSGKSSLVRAGLIPALRSGVLPKSESWSIATFTPGAHPLTALAAQMLRLYPQDAMHRTLDALATDERTLHLATALALADQPESERVVWVVDQFEEIFTLCQGEAERAAFLDNLLYAASLEDGRCTVLFTLRADFYQKCAAYPDLSARLSTQQFLVSPMDQGSLRRAIEEPAWHVGLEFEEGLVETILADIARQPGALPLLEHALLELWERRRGQMLTLEGYRQSGGVQGAIAKRADTIYNALTPEQQQIARRALLRLTQPGEGTEDTRRRATLSELMTQGASSMAVETVVRELVDARLLTTSEEDASHQHLIEVSHEALIRGWPRLRAWLDEDRTGLRLQQRLTEAAQEWMRLGQDESLLYRGLRLAEALEWRTTHEAALNALERAFLDTSAALKQREEEAEQARQQRELEAAQRLAATERQRAEAANALAHSEQRRGRIARLLSSGLAILLVIALVAASVALQQRSQAQTAQTRAVEERNVALTAQHTADQQRNVALRAQRIITSRALAADAVLQLPNDPELSLLLARAAIQQVPTNAAYDALRQSLVASHVRMTLRGHSGIVYSAVFSRNGTEILSAGADGTARLWDAQTGRALAVLRSGHTGAVYAAFSPDSQTVVTAGPDANARLWQASNGHLLKVLHGHTAPINAVAFSPDGRDLATAGQDDTVRVWNVATGRLLLVLRGHTKSIISVAYSPDGSELVTASADGTARLWNAHNGSVIAVLRGHTDIVAAASFSPNGRFVVTASFDHTARLWDARTGALLHVLTSQYGPNGPVVAASFSPDSQWVVTASLDRRAMIWSTATGALRWELLGHTSMLYGASFSPDGRYVLTASDDGSARLWTVALGTQVAVLRGQKSGVASAAFSPDGKEIVTAGKDGTVDIWDPGVGRLFASIPPHEGCLAGNATRQASLSAIAISRDGRYVATAGTDCRAHVWDAHTGRLIATLAGHTQSVQSLAFSPDGRWLVTGSADFTARVWNTHTWQTDAVLRGHTGTVNGVAFSPNGRLLATASADGTTRLWDVATWRTRRVLQGPGPGLLAVTFSPSGQWLVTTTLPSSFASGGKAIVWAVDSGKPVQSLSGFTDTVYAAAFSPDGRYLAAGGADTVTLVWNTATWQLAANLQEPQSILLGGVDSIAFTSDGHWLLTGSSDGSVRAWEVGNWQLIATLPGQAFGIAGVAVSPDDQSIFTAGFDGTARVFPCDFCGTPAALLARSATRITRHLTPGERQTYLQASMTG